MDVNTASRSTYCDDESLYLVTGICGWALGTVNLLYLS